MLSSFGIDSVLRLKHEEGTLCDRNVHAAYELRIRKRTAVHDWFRVIGTHNPKHLTKYLLFQKEGHLPPKTTIDERIALLA